MGNGYASRAVTGPWGALSVVTGPFAGDIVTKPSVPLLDRNGDDTGRDARGRRHDDADRRTQIALAAKANSLWAQGGTPTDPVLNQQYPGTFGFGALRCAVDVLNGDNVEWIGYPAGAKHVFCYAYYVVPPPTSGTIVVRKVVDDPTATATQSFGFQGDISYTPDGTFAIAASAGKPGSATFYRAAGQTWSWRELDLPGWMQVGLSCTSQTGASQTRTDARHRRGLGRSRGARTRSRAPTPIGPCRRRPACCCPRSRAVGSGASTSTCPGPTTPPRPSRRPTRARRWQARSCR